MSKQEKHDKILMTETKEDTLDRRKRKKIMRAWVYQRIYEHTHTHTHRNSASVRKGWYRS